MRIPFFKFQGAGNDFIIIDNRLDFLPLLSQETIEKWCNRRFGVGADGLMLLNKHEVVDFKMVYYNSDGAESTLCGNGARCIAALASLLNNHKNKFRFEAIDGMHDAQILDFDQIDAWQVSVAMHDVNFIALHRNDWVLNTGSPHYVRLVNQVETFDVKSEGEKVRNSEAFKQQGINVNFLEKLDVNSIFIRTYERGVEDETLSCGTGVTAAALVFAQDKTDGNHKIQVKTKGGLLQVNMLKQGDIFTEIQLIGPATLVFIGVLEL